MAELEKYVKQEKQSRTVAFLEQIKDELMELITKRYTNDDIINVLNKALKDDAFRRKYNAQISVVRGDEVRKFLNALRKEIKDGKRDKNIAKTSEAMTRKENEITNISSSTSSVQKHRIPEGIDEEL